ncbi:MAG: hypothetical protein NVS3B12_09530 [Acidimicrobiales bacterium]
MALLGAATGLGPASIPSFAVGDSPLSPDRRPVNIASPTPPPAKPTGANAADTPASRATPPRTLAPGALPLRPTSPLIAALAGLEVRGSAANGLAQLAGAPARVSLVGPVVNPTALGGTAARGALVRTPPISASPQTVLAAASTPAGSALSGGSVSIAAAPTQTSLSDQQTVGADAREHVGGGDPRGHPRREAAGGCGHRKGGQTDENHRKACARGGSDVTRGERQR